MDLLLRMLEYDPSRRITAAQTLDHPFFRADPLPGPNVFMNGTTLAKTKYPPRVKASATAAKAGARLSSPSGNRSCPVGAWVGR